MEPDPGRPARRLGLPHRRLRRGAAVHRARRGTPGSPWDAGEGSRFDHLGYWSADIERDAENAYLASHPWEQYAEWHLGLTEGAADETKARYGFVYGDFRRVHRSGLIACHYRAAEWRHKAVELAAHDLLQALDRTAA